ncbi:PAS domain-containing protein [Pararhizobium qamdonense]|uniref:PAS domain-containing protein n=1 Tax=Pararhizobium qamdonense TaxID=3031126 RepID=UPI002E1E85F4
MPTHILLTVICAVIVGFASGYVWRVWSTRHERLVDKYARAIVEGMPGHGWSNDPDGRFTYVSPPALRYYGLDDSFIKMNGFKRGQFHEAYANMLAQIIHPEDLQGTLDHWAKTLKSGEPATYEYRLRRWDGVYLWHRLAVHPARDDAGSITAWYGTQIDIEVEKVAELALRKREQELQRLIDALPVSIWCCDLDGYVTHFSKRLQTFFGCELDDIPHSQRRVSRSNPGLIHPDDAGLAEDLLKHSLETGEPLSARYRMRRADGIYRWTEQRGELLRDADGKPLQWYGVAIDIDALKREEDALRYREQELRQLIDVIPMMIWTVGDERGNTYFNKPLLTFTGITPEDDTGTDGLDAGRAMAELVHPDDLPALVTLYNSNPGDNAVVTMRYRLRRADGVYRWVEGRYAGLRDASSGKLRQYGFLIDVEEEVQSQAALRSMQEKLGDAARAASLAELAASIAHEVNQPLTAIISNAEACHRWLTLASPNVDRAIASAEAMINNATDAAEIVSSIRSLFRRSSRARVIENVNTVIQEVTRIIGVSDIGVKVGIRTELASNIPTVMMDRVQIQQILVNLIRNGLEALDGSEGTVSPIIVRSRYDETHVIVEVIDDGVGLPTEAGIGQAFFTTKDDGMGMGLVICRSIVEAHNGDLWHTKNSPQGTIFAFSLPISGTEEDGAQPSHDDAADISKFAS